MTPTTTGPVSLTITSDATADGALYLPQTWFNDGATVADRLLVTPAADTKRRTVLKTSIRNTGEAVAGVSPRTFHSLGGRGQGRLACQTARATWWHILRYVDGAALSAAIAVLSAASAGFAAWFGLRDGLDKVDGSHAAFLVVGAAFVVNALLAILTLQRDLRDL
jgi:hypothetical protein